MTYSIEEIIEIFKEFNPEHFTAMDCNSLVTFIESKVNEKWEWTWDEGATKCVIIPKKENFVIKVPFDGEIHDSWFDEEEDEFTFFYNGGGYEGWNYCELEREYYDELIKDNEFKDFFLYPERINEKGWPIYIQSKVSVYADLDFSNDFIKPESLKVINSFLSIEERKHLPAPWLSIVLENLGKNIDKLNSFIEYLNANFSDLHRNNIGISKDGHAVIFDYGGYGE